MLDSRTVISPWIGRVTREDLDRLPEIHALLFALDDPAAAAPKLAALCESLPPLEARLMDLARRKSRLAPRDVRSAIALLGNRVVEKVLLELLEDLTVLKFELQPG